MILHSQLQYLTDIKGNVASVVVPLALWEKIEPKIRPLLAESEEPQPLAQAQGPLRNFDDFLKFWDFKYSYSPAVTCPHCGASALDWRNDPEDHFVLTNANIGGLLVFHCRSCGTTIRQKHFRDHVAVEHSTPKE